MIIIMHLYLDREIVTITISFIIFSINKPTVMIITIYEYQLASS